ncbi:hypothetical protein MUK42_32053 [Musa troglodytarum]|uniref:Uncharacterized protein n=1 Tax=Musa troglodytarum TaxID=320322 RepID=A0A9E7FK11_9LILI|nr:hypothetical protein MUK42_32053 [Musa troglodytarum]
MAGEDVSMMTREKVEKAEEDRKEIFLTERRWMVSEYAQVHFDEPSVNLQPTVTVKEGDPHELAVANSAVMRIKSAIAIALKKRIWPVKRGAAD